MSLFRIFCEFLSGKTKEHTVITMIIIFCHLSKRFVKITAINYKFLGIARDIFLRVIDKQDNGYDHTHLLTWKQHSILSNYL